MKINQEYLLGLCAILLLYFTIKYDLYDEPSQQYTPLPVEVNQEQKNFSGTLYLDAAHYGAVPTPEQYTQLDTLYNAHQQTPFQTVVYIINGQDTLGYYPIKSK